MSWDSNKESSSPLVRIGFVELIDAAPLIAAFELGYFAEEGLAVSLERQIGWGNVRDKLIYGHLHASHAVLGLSPLSLLGRDRYPAPLTTIMSLGTGGNAITLSRNLTDAGISTAEDLLRRSRSHRSTGGPLLAHVFGCSMHHYLLRDWLAAGGVDPDRDVRLCVLPPTQMNRQLQTGYLDGFCSGEPWNTAAERDGLGRVVAVTTDVIPDHPEKVLAASQNWLVRNMAVAESLIRATLRGCQYCGNPANIAPLSQMLAKTEYLAMPAEVVLKSLTIERWYGGATRRHQGSIRSCALNTTFPSATHAAWLLKQMSRWGQLPPETDVMAIAEASVNSGPYRAVASKFDLVCPPTDTPPMRLRNGWFDPKPSIDSKKLFIEPPSIVGKRAAGLERASQGV